MAAGAKAGGWRFSKEAAGEGEGGEGGEEGQGEPVGDAGDGVEVVDGERAEVDEGVVVVDMEMARAGVEPEVSLGLAGPMWPMGEWGGRFAVLGGEEGWRRVEMEMFDGVGVDPDPAGGGFGMVFGGLRPVEAIALDVTFGAEEGGEEEQDAGGAAKEADEAVHEDSFGGHCSGLRDETRWSNS